jgi:UDP-N-acetylmuramoylalanine--D-glutamate ligase
MHTLRGKNVTVFGLGRFGGGIAVTRWLVGQGADVLVVDQDSREKLSASVAQLADLPVRFRLGDAGESDFWRSDLIVASPAVPPHNGFLIAARAAGVPITTEIRLFIERCPAPIIGVTGTKGKSTATALLGLMLARRMPTHIGGNIGGSLLAKLPEIAPTDRVVLELSSYMLAHLGEIEFSPHIALVTMIGADHLDWHGSREAYVAAKRNILRFQRREDFAVLCSDDPGAAALAEQAIGNVVGYSLADCRPFELRLPGRHNQLNAQGAFAAAAIAGVSWEQAQAAIADFPGLPHRLQLVHESDGVRWFNDSIATIPDAALAALESFAPGKVIQIIGGKDKHLPIDSLCSGLRARAKAVLCVGSTGSQLADALRPVSASSAAAEEGRGEGLYPIVLDCGCLPKAVAEARRLAAAGDVVLLSPGYPSYDQFVNFEERGRSFADLARLA